MGVIKNRWRRLLWLGLILVLVSGCAAIPGSATDPTSPGTSSPAIENSEKTGATSQDLITVSDEKNYSMHSGELFARNGHILIYAEPGSGIYMVDTADNSCKQLVKSNTIHRLYFDGTYVYYLPYYYMGRGIYRTDLQGNTEKICTNSSIQLWLTEDKIYFTDQIGFDDINQTPRGNLCTMNKDGTNIQVVIKNVGNYFYIQDQWIYYTDLNNRDLYRAHLDGSQKELLAEGRTYITSADYDYLIYTDYENSEAQHLLNTRTGENTMVGQFGTSRCNNGRFYIQTRKLGINGIPTFNGWSVLQVNQTTGKVVTSAFLPMEQINIDIFQYAFKGWIYFYSTDDSGPEGQRGTYRVKLDNSNFEAEYVVDGYLYCIDGDGYYIEEKAPDQPTGFARINLQTGEITRWPFL